MIKIKLISTVITLTLIFSLIGCSSPSSSVNPDNSDSSSGSTDTGLGDNGNGNGSGGAGTGGDSGSGGGSTDNTTPQYEWLMTHYEMETHSTTDTSSSEVNYSSDYTYSFYSSYYNYGLTTADTINTIITFDDNTTNSTSNTKSEITYAKTGNDITYLANQYTWNGNTWILTADMRIDYFKSTLGPSSTYTKLYPAGTETTTSNTVELLDNSNGIEHYKVTDSSNTMFYAVYEFVNNKIQKIITYYTDSNKKYSETDYIYSNNSILQANNIEMALTQTKNFDNNEQLTTQTNQTLENVTLNANNTITVRLGSSTNTSTNYSYITETFSRIQVPFSQQ